MPVLFGEEVVKVVHVQHVEGVRRVTSIREVVDADGGRIVSNEVFAPGPDGGGVPNLQPALTNNAVVRGEVATLLKVILHGPAAVLPADRPKYSNLMPGFGPALNDVQAADLATYLRQAFAADNTPVTPAQAAAARKAP